MKIKLRIARIDHLFSNIHVNHKYNGPVQKPMTLNNNVNHNAKKDINGDLCENVIQCINDSKTDSFVTLIARWLRKDYARHLYNILRHVRFDPVRDSQGNIIR